MNMVTRGEPRQAASAICAAVAMCLKRLGYDLLLLAEGFGLHLPLACARAAFASAFWRSYSDGGFLLRLDFGGFGPAVKAADEV